MSTINTFKKIFFHLFLFINYSLFSQTVVDTIAIKDTIPAKPQSHWKVTGNNSLALAQNAFSNWMAGGTNSFGATAKVDYNFNYKKDKNIWDNKIIIGYGQLSTEGNKPKKTDDILSLASTYGYSINGKWYAAAGATLLTQIANGYDYNATPNYSPKNRISAFMAPGYMTLGIGVDYKPNDNFRLTLRPITARATFVLDKKLQKKDKFGLQNDGDFWYVEFGALIGLAYKTEIMKNITWNNNLNLFNNYISHPERVYISYHTDINMKVNNYISTVFSFDALYDHYQIKKLQVKQTFGVGLVYQIRSKSAELNDVKK